jgi:rod shape determining protein RodA
MRKRIFKNIDWGIFICAIILTSIGMIALFSATHDSGYESLQKQVIWFVVCIPIVFILILIDYELLAKAAPVFYRN